jgi:beta-phosphoglucomutase-like phosphatase (HAD superfamily)
MTSTAPVVTVSPRDCDAVLFDLDRVLTKTASVHAAAWQPSAKRAGSERRGATPATPSTQTVYALGNLKD